MRKKITKINSLLLSVILIVSAAPLWSISVSAKTYITDAGSAKGENYTSSPVLAAMLNQVFSGDIGMYSDQACASAVSAPLGSSPMTGSNRYYVKSNTTGSVTWGYQCYIYANAVYNRLFNEWVGGGPPFAHSEAVIGGGYSSLSYSMLSSAGVKTGAYIRTTPSSSGTYNGSAGHSLIILYYDLNNITCLEGNADGNGLVRITSFSWNEFNDNQLSGRSRYTCHIVQPTAPYYEALYPSVPAPLAYSVRYELDGGTMEPEVKASGTASGINKIRGQDDLIIYTRGFGLSTGTNMWGLEAVVDSFGFVTSVHGYDVGNSAIPEGGFVLSGHDAGTTLLYHTAVGDYALFDPETLYIQIFPNEESYLIAAKKVYNGQAYGELPTPEREGCVFAGWYDISGNAVNSSTVFQGGCDITLYARWIFKKGDVNGDGKLEISDARLCLRAAVNLEILSDAQKLAADVDGDGAVRISDARAILRVSVGLEVF